MLTMYTTYQSTVVYNVIVQRGRPTIYTIKNIIINSILYSNINPSLRTALYITKYIKIYHDKALKELL